MIIIRRWSSSKTDADADVNVLSPESLKGEALADPASQIGDSEGDFSKKADAKSINQSAVNSQDVSDNLADNVKTAIIEGTDSSLNKIRKNALITELSNWLAELWTLHYL